MGINTVYQSKDGFRQRLRVISPDGIMIVTERGSDDMSIKKVLQGTGGPGFDAERRAYSTDGVSPTLGTATRTSMNKIKILVPDNTKAGSSIVKIGGGNEYGFP